MGSASQLHQKDEPHEGSTMTEPPGSSLRKDFRVFRDPGFLVTLLLIGLLAVIGAYLLVQASNEYGIPVREYWR
jgi:hypothetical protein